MVAVIVAPRLLSSGGSRPRGDCTDIVMIAARESGVAQSDHDGIGRTGQIFRDTYLRRLNATGLTLAVRPVVYPAAPVFFEDVRPSPAAAGPPFDPTPLNAYYASERAGVLAAQRAIAAAADDIERCGGTQHIVLFGYSQGAQVMGDVLSSLPPRTMSMLSGAALFADPQFNPREDPGVMKGDFDPEREGLFGARPALPPALSGKVVSYCRTKDVACQGLRLQPGAAPAYCPMPVRLEPANKPPVDGYYDLDCRPDPDLNVHKQYLFLALQAANTLANRARLFGERMSMPSPPIPQLGRPLDVVFVIDTTSSMTLYTDASRAAVNEVAQQLVASGGDYRFGLATFRDRAEAYVSRVDLPFTRDIASLHDALEKMITAGGTDVPEAAYSGLMTAFAYPWRSDAKRTVVILSDAPPKDPEPVSELTRPKVMRAAQEAGAVIYSVIAGTNSQARDALGSIANEAGGRPFPITSLDELAPTLGTAINEASKTPIAQFNGGSYSAVPSIPVRLYGVGSFDSDGDVVRYEWDVDGDGNYDAATTEPFLDHTYGAPGNYVLRLRVTDNDGRTATATAQMVVSAVKPLPPGAPTALSASPGDRAVGLHWAAPPDNGSPILYYVIRDANGAPTVVVRGAATDGVVDGLTNGVLYRFDVTAFSQRGPGVASAPVDVRPGG